MKNRKMLMQLGIVVASSGFFLVAVESGVADCGPVVQSTASPTPRNRIKSHSGSF